MDGLLVLSSAVTEESDKSLIPGKSACAVLGTETLWPWTAQPGAQGGTSAWHSPSCCGHLGNEPGNKRSLSLPPPFKQKTKSALMMMMTHKMLFILTLTPYAIVFYFHITHA